MPQNAEGMRIEPAPSEPWWSGPSPAAAAAPAPALEPPDVMPVFHGLRVMPVSGLSPSAFQPNSGVVVLPSMIAARLVQPAHVRRVHLGHAAGEDVRAAHRAARPCVKRRSLIENGRPWSGPSGSPVITACSAARAAASAASAVTVQNALSVGFSRSIRSSTARVSSTGDSFLRADQRGQLGRRREGEIGGGVIGR